MTRAVSRARLGQWMLSTVCLTAMGFAPACVFGQTPKAGEVVGISRPSEERKLTFATQGLVKETLVKEGEAVKAGQALVAQDDEIDLKELERLKLLADSTARVEAADASIELKRSVVKRKTDPERAGAFTEAEIEEAKNDLTLAEKQKKVSEEEQQEAKIKAEQQAKKLEKMKILSPYDGIVASIVSKAGEWADPQNKDGAIVVVQNDPVYIEVTDLSTRQVAMLKPGQKLQVRYANDKENAWHDAEIFFFAPVANAGADTQPIKLRMPNPEGRASGMQMFVKLPQNVAEAGAVGGGQASR